MHRQRRTRTLTSIFTTVAMVTALAGITVKATAATPPPAASSTHASAATPLAAPAMRSFNANGLRQQNLAIRYVGGFLQYRVPALAVTTKGTLIVAYGGRPSMHDLPSHIVILVRRSTNGGKTWSPQQVVRQAPAPAGFSDSNLLVDRRTGRIFLFYAASMNEGFFGSHTGNNPNNPNILQTDYSYSDDDGLTWHSRRITQQVKNPAWEGLFATSGEGIQLQQGPYAGRLIQQYVIRIGRQVYAASLYSDNNGKTWTMGQPVGPGMNENKTVGLVDGSVLLDVRARPKRLFAISHNGGKTYSTPYPVPALTDPGDNGSIIRYAPKAPASNPKSHWLLESNTDDPSIRRNLVVRMSCDDGKTWPIARVVDPGSAAYSTLTMEPHSRIGLFYERDGYRELTYTSFTLKWLDGVCAPLTVQAPSITAGSQNVLHVIVTNETAHLLKAGQLSLKAPKGWSSKSVPVGPIDAGAHATVDLPFTASDKQAGQIPLTVYYTSQGKHSLHQITTSVKRDPSAPDAPDLSVLPVLDHLTAGGPNGLMGDVATYWIRVTNSGNTTLRNVTLTGDMAHLAKCVRSALVAGASYVCRSGTHRISPHDRLRGRYVPRLTAKGAAPNGTKAIATVTGEVVKVPPQLP